MSAQRAITPAKKFGRRFSGEQSDVTLSGIGCPLCGSEMNAEITVRTVYGSISGPYAAVSMKLQCQSDDCKYYERVTAQAYDNDTLKEVERQALKFEAAIYRNKSKSEEEKDAAQKAEQPEGYCE
jgi:hypothetical protein